MSTHSSSIAASGQALYLLAYSAHSVAKTQDVVVPELKRISISAETPEHPDAYPFEYQSADAMLRVAEGFLAGAGHDISTDEEDDDEELPITCCERHNLEWHKAEAEKVEKPVKNEAIGAGSEPDLEPESDGSKFNTSIRKSTGGDRYLVHIHTDLNTLKANGDETSMDNLVLLCRLCRARHNRQSDIRLQSATGRCIHNGNGIGCRTGCIYLELPECCADFGTTGTG